MKRPKRIDLMNAVAEEIIKMDFDWNKSFIQVREDFYNIMRKYGIKQGTKQGNFVNKNNFEWTICESLFQTTLHNRFHFETMFHGVPEDLDHY